ncbi:aminodeoxychorismate lyase [Moraxella caviae]|uniref:Endolytic murein transglycosylase n=1 Tax=Moraxella caviae TaxID=34060 RepID=A0A1T0ABV8_9GAMM|nr:endolytic transglycosylase MltG [Moraxella caviae]OOR93193.1 aminodeoxychorismate lyase [Moraxella caviae]STZ10464.1 putative aminodeoxychorismate lyase [Moraxella caviae]VEW10672.1 putative aminodeoxychorismate lyase [Moraxella caviae]
MTKSPKSSNSTPAKRKKPSATPRNSGRAPKQKPSSGKKWLGFLSLSALLVIAAGLFVVYTTIFAPTKHDEQTITVHKGDTFYGLLVKKPWQTSVFSSETLTKAYLKWAAKDDLQAGAYEIPANASLREMVEILSQGSDAEMISVRIIEGKTVRDLYRMLKNTDGVVLEVLSPQTDENDGYSWVDTAKDNEAVSKALGISSPNGNLEGLFAPNTYFFHHGVSDRQILQKLYDDQQAVLEAAWEARSENLPYKTPYEALIMASIIEKETGLADERGTVSAVFVNRLNQGMRLQTDPTIIYGLFDRYNGKIYRSNIREKTEYNTYQIDGLPPTPIALPSKAAIEAALHPEDTDVIFFVATGKGGHTFSRTLAEHEEAVAAYRKAIGR